MGFTDIQLIRSLDDAGVNDGAQLGGKAATLAELKRAGFPVPEGVVVTTDALTRALASAGLGAAAPSEDVEAMLLPADLVAALSAATEQLGNGPFAVRSSGVEEDLPGASYAGQYETVLNVPAEDVPTAVRHCLASAFSHRVQHTANPKEAQARRRWRFSSCRWCRPTQPAWPSAPIRSAVIEAPRSSMQSAALASAWSPGRRPPTSGSCVMARPTPGRHL